jgi:hypothetical protein
MLRLFTTIALVALPGAASAAAAQGRGRVACVVTDNGDPGSGTLSVRRGSTEVAAGSCGSPVAVPAGAYDVVVQLDGALDRPAQTHRVTVSAGRTETVTAAFRTGTLVVDITANGRRAAAMAKLLRGGEQVGSLASGVPVRVSAGTYDVVVRYRGEERRFSGVTVSAGQQRTVSAEL